MTLASEVLAAFSLEATGVPVHPAAGVVELPCRYTHSGHCITTQSNELARGNTELVQHFHSFIGGVHIGARALLDINLYGLAISLAYPSGSIGGSVQIISTCLRYGKKRGGGGQHTVHKI